MMTTAALSEQDKAFLARLATIDFGPLAFKLTHPEESPGWTLEQATYAIEQYRRFLFLTYRYPDREIVPTREIDQVWHTHILDTAKYREDCETLFGHFLEHWPYFGIRDERDRQNLHHAFAETQILFQTHFRSA
jgi:hypothetical protein